MTYSEHLNFIRQVTKNLSKDTKIKLYEIYISKTQELVESEYPDLYDRLKQVADFARKEAGLP